MFLISPLKMIFPWPSFFSEILPTKTQFAEKFTLAFLAELFDDVYLGCANFGMGGGV